ncbi:MAG: hypothetical protein ABI559_09300 [Chloroflexota bacterium]
MRTVDEIPVAYTPPGGWHGEMPAPILAGCDEPIMDDAPDLRGTWRTVRVERDGVELPDHHLTKHVERIEQCGDRVVVTSEGIIHDMRADGVLEHGVHDVAGGNNFDSPVHVAAVFNAGRLDLHPMGVHPERPPLVTREVIGGELIWHYGPLIVTMRRTDDHVQDAG